MNCVADLVGGHRPAIRCSPPVSSDVSPKMTVAPASTSRSTACADRRARAEAGRRVGLAALDADDELRRARPARAAAPSRHWTSSFAARAAWRTVSRSPWPSIEKPATGLPVSAMPSTIALGPGGLDPDDDRRGDVRVRAGADHRSEVQVEVLAVLQPAVGVRQRKRAGDLRRDSLACGVRNVVDGQDDHVVADADVSRPVAGSRTTPCLPPRAS